VFNATSSIAKLCCAFVIRSSVAFWSIGTGFSNADQANYETERSAEKCAGCSTRRPLARRTTEHHSTPDCTADIGSRASNWGCRVAIAIGTDNPGDNPAQYCLARQSGDNLAGYPVKRTTAILDGKSNPIDD
jgi:hypothetical protein